MNADPNAESSVLDVHEGRRKLQLLAPVELQEKLLE